MDSVTSSSLTPPQQQNGRAENNESSVETPSAGAGADAVINVDNKQQQQSQLHKDIDSDMDSKEYIERYNKIEADFSDRLMAKYFSDKDIFGDSVFDGVKIINGETIKTSRVHCAQSYADPVQYLKDKKSRTNPPAETQNCVTNGEHSIKEEPLIKEEPSINDGSKPSINDGSEPSSIKEEPSIKEEEK